MAEKRQDPWNWPCGVVSSLDEFLFGCDNTVIQKAALAAFEGVVQEGDYSTRLEVVGMAS